MSVYIYIDTLFTIKVTEHRIKSDPPIAVNYVQNSREDFQQHIPIQFDAAIFKRIDFLCLDYRSLHVCIKLKCHISAVTHTILGSVVILNLHREISSGKFSEATVKALDLDQLRKSLHLPWTP